MQDSEVGAHVPSSTDTNSPQCSTDHSPNNTYNSTSSDDAITITPREEETHGPNDPDNSTRLLVSPRAWSPRLQGEF